MADNEMDSWDEEEEKEWQKQRDKGYNESYRKDQQRRAARDLRKYRNGYPDRPKVNLCQGEILPEMQNLDFYLNKKRFKPNGEFIEVILDQWKNDYELLERNHSYIQWLFPLQEPGMNFKARMLTKVEIQMMIKDKEVQRRFLEAYKLMLGFYGINLVNEATGEVERAKKFEERFDNLDYHSHNNLRITRILKCLGELGFEHYQAPLVKFFLVETLVERRLQSVKNSVLDYFMFTVKDKQQRRDLVHFAYENYEPRHKFIWGPIGKLGGYKKSSDRDSDVGETDGKGNKTKIHEAEKVCGEHGDGKPQVGGDDDDDDAGNKTLSHVGVAHDIERQAKHGTLDQNVGGSRGRQDKGQGPRNEEEGKESKGSSNKGEDAVLGTSGCGTDNNTQMEGSSVDEDDKVEERMEQKVESLKRCEEDNETKVTIEMENKGEPSASEKETESHDGSDPAAGGAECPSKEKGSTDPVEETKKSNNDKSESSGGSDSDSKKTGQKLNGRKRSSDGNRKDCLPQNDSTNDDELSCKLTKNCTIIPPHPVTTGNTDEDDDAKKVKLEKNSNGDSEAGVRFPATDPDESEGLLDANEPPHQLNVKPNPLQDTAGGNCNTGDQTTTYL